MKPDIMPRRLLEHSVFRLSAMHGRFQQHDLVPAELVFLYGLEVSYQSELCHITINRW